MALIFMFRLANKRTKKYYHSFGCLEGWAAREMMGGAVERKQKHRVNIEIYIFFF